MEQPEQIGTVKYVTENGMVVDLPAGRDAMIEYNEDNPDNKIVKPAEQSPEN